MKKGEVPRQTAARDSAHLRPLTTHPPRGPLSSRDDRELERVLPKRQSAVKVSAANPRRSSLARPQISRPRSPSAATIGALDGKQAP
jgi:hypothetical protein